MKILIVEDEEKLRNSLAEGLRLKGYDFRRLVPGIGAGQAVVFFIWHHHHASFAADGSNFPRAAL